MKYIKDNKIYASVTHVVLNGMQIFNPSAAQIKQAGYEEYTEPAIAEPKEEELAEQEKQSKIAELKAELQEYDYIGVKIAMGVATIEEYSEKIAYTETLRKKINELQES